MRIIRAGWGLLGMQERVTYLGGEFDIQSEPGGGALLSVELPLTESLAAAPIA